jgi:hypothetical protein
MIFAWGGERGFFIMFLVIGQPNGPLQKKKERKKEKPSKHLCFGMHHN